MSKLSKQRYRRAILPYPYSPDVQRARANFWVDYTESLDEREWDVQSKWYYADVDYDGDEAI